MIGILSSVQSITEVIPEVIAGSAAPLIFLILALIVIWNCKFRSSPPGPSFCMGIGPIVSYIHFLWKGIGKACNYYNDKYGEFVRVWIMGEETLIISRPSAAYNVLKHAGYCSRFGNEFGLQCVGMRENGIIFNNNPDSVKQIRPIFMKALTGSRLQNVTAVSVASTKAYLERLDQVTDNGQVNVLKLARLIVLDINNKLFLRVPLDENEILGKIQNYFDSWQTLLLKPHLFFKFSWLYKKHEENAQELRMSMKNLIMKKRQSIAESEKLEEDTDFATDLIFAQDHGDLTSENVCQCLLEMMIAAPDTMSVSLYFIFMLIAQHPDVQEGLIEEIKTVSGDNEVENSDLPQMKLMESCINEAMRYMPVVDIIMRRAMEDNVIDGHYIKKGTNVILNIKRMNRNEFFPKPNEFSLQNFETAVPNRYFQPFGSGPRACVGKHIAMVMMKVITATLLKKYKLHTLDGRTVDDIKNINNLSQHPEEPQSRLEMIFIARRKANP
uniref:aromatase n=1 Tax=Protopterus annectens TaxID=7888 RepID=A0A2U9NKL2_PROAN|nr:CYP19A1 [Protopterus annectens]